MTLGEGDVAVLAKEVRGKDAKGFGEIFVVQEEKKLQRIKTKKMIKREVKYRELINPLDKFTRKISLRNRGWDGYRDIQKGDKVTFLNESTYCKKHLIGDSASWDTICIDSQPGHQLFCQVGLPKIGVEEAVMEKRLIMDYNIDPDIEAEMISNSTWKRICEEYGPDYLFDHITYAPKEINAAMFSNDENSGFYPIVTRLDFDLIKYIHQLPEDKVSWDAVDKFRAANGR